MADHSITVKLATAPITRLTKQLNDLKTNVRLLSRQIDRLANSLEKNVEQIRALVKSVPTIRYAKVNQSTSSSRASGAGVTRPGSKLNQSQLKGIANQQGYVEWWEQVLGIKTKVPPKLPPAPHAPPNFADYVNQAKQQAGRGNLSGAGSKLLTGLAAFNSGALGNIAKFVLRIAPLTGLFRLLSQALLPIITIASGLVYGLVKFSEALREATLSAQRLNSLTNSDPNLRQRAKGIGAALGMDPEKVASDAWSQGHPNIFYAKLQAILNSKSQEQANIAANQMGMGDYAPLWGKPKSVQDRIMKGQDTSGMGSQTNAFKMATQNFSDVVQILDRLKDRLMAFLAVAVDGSVIFQDFLMRIKALDIFFSLFEMFSNWLRQFLHLDTAKKLDKAADKLDKSADKLLQGAGYYGGGERTRAALKGAYIDKAGSNDAGLRKTLKQLGSL